MTQEQFTASIIEARDAFLAAIATDPAGAADHRTVLDAAIAAAQQERAVTAAAEAAVAAAEAAVQAAIAPPAPVLPTRGFRGRRNADGSPRIAAMDTVRDGKVVHKYSLIDAPDAAIIHVIASGYPGMRPGSAARLSLLRDGMTVAQARDVGVSRAYVQRFIETGCVRLDAVALRVAA